MPVEYIANPHDESLDTYEKRTSTKADQLLSRSYVHGSQNSVVDPYSFGNEEMQPHTDLSAVSDVLPENITAHATFSTKHSHSATTSSEPNNLDNRQSRYIILRRYDKVLYEGTKESTTKPMLFSSRIFFTDLLP